MTPVTAAKVKYGVWGLICGAIIAMTSSVLTGVDHREHDQKNGRRVGLGGSGGDLRRPIYEGTEPSRDTARIREIKFLPARDLH